MARAADTERRFRLGSLPQRFGAPGRADCAAGRDSDGGRIRGAGGGAQGRASRSQEVGKPPGVFLLAEMAVRAEKNGRTRPGCSEGEPGERRERLPRAARTNPHRARPPSTDDTMEANDLQNDELLDLEAAAAALDGDYDFDEDVADDDFDDDDDDDEEDEDVDVDDDDDDEDDDDDDDDLLGGDDDE